MRRLGRQHPLFPRDPKQLLATATRALGPLGKTGALALGQAGCGPRGLPSSCVLTLTAADGSPAAIFFAPGSGTGANEWLLFLEGSMFCWDQDSCTERYQTHPYWMSSKGWAYEMAQGGIFATDGSSQWGTANRAFLKYCTSDFHSGDVGASDATFGFAFRGSRVVAAAVTKLLSMGMEAPGSNFLFAGCSAGAIGAMNNIEAVHAQMPAGVTMKVLLDAAGLLDLTATGWEWSDRLTPLTSIMAANVALAQSVIPASCAAHFPGEAWKWCDSCAPGTAPLSTDARAQHGG